MKTTATLITTTAALALLALSACSVGVENEDGTPSTTAPPTPEQSSSATDDESADDGTAAADSDVAVVPGYGPGEIPEVPMIQMPDLGLLSTAEAAFATETASELGEYPGLSVEPVGCDADGQWISGTGTLSLYGDGSSYTAGDGQSVTINDDGSGSAFDVDGTSVIVGPDGSGVVTVGDTTVSVNVDGSGAYFVEDGTSITLDGEGGGTQTFANGDTIVINADGSGRFTQAGSVVSWSNEGDGGGLYADGTISVSNDGDGTATIQADGGYTDVDAEPLEPLAPLGSFPTIAALEPRESCGTTITLESEILFDVDSAELRPEAQDLLTSLATALTDGAVPAATIAGHTDSVRDTGYNQTLSEDRAASVAAALTELGVTSDLTTVGFGETQPVASNDTAQGRQENRRVEIFIPAF